MLIRIYSHLFKFIQMKLPIRFKWYALEARAKRKTVKIKFKNRA